MTPNDRSSIITSPVPLGVSTILEFVVSVDIVLPLMLRLLSVSNLPTVIPLVDMVIAAALLVVKIKVLFVGCVRTFVSLFAEYTPLKLTVAVLNPLNNESVVLNLNSPCVSVVRSAVVPTGTRNAFVPDITKLLVGVENIIPSFTVSVLIVVPLNLTFSNFGPPVLMPDKIRLSFPTIVVM